MTRMKILGKKIKIPRSMKKIMKNIPKFPTLSKRTKKSIKRNVVNGVKMAEKGISTTETHVKKVVGNLPKMTKQMKKRGKNLVRASKKISKTKVKDLTKKDLSYLMNSIDK